MDVRDPRVIEEGKTYDVIVLDLPDPDSPEMQELYTYVVKTVIPAVSKNHVTVKVHVGPAVLTNKQHSNWAFIETFQMDMEDMFYKTGRRTEYRLEVDYIPSYMHEWGFALCVAWKDPTINAGAFRQPSPSCCSRDADDDDCDCGARPSYLNYDCCYSYSRHHVCDGHDDCDDRRSYSNSNSNSYSSCYFRYSYYRHHDGAGDDEPRRPGPTYPGFHAKPPMCHRCAQPLP
jgi:hypothetical protein